MITRWMYSNGGRWNFSKLRSMIVDAIIDLRTLHNDNNIIGKVLVTKFESDGYIEFEIKYIQEEYVDRPHTIMGPMFDDNDVPVLYLSFDTLPLLLL